MEAHARLKAAATPWVGIAVSPDSRLWLSVKCGWCSGKMAGGCLMCGGKRREAEAVAADPSFAALSAAAGGDDLARAALGDLLEERLGVRCGL